MSLILVGDDVIVVVDDVDVVVACLLGIGGFISIV